MICLGGNVCQAISFSIFIKFSALKTDVNIVSFYNFHIILFLIFLKTCFEHRIVFVESYYIIIKNCDIENLHVLKP